MKSGSSCGALCQHPECWRSNLQRVKDAVRLRNGIQPGDSLESKEFHTLSERKRLDDGTLPTLKVVDVFDGTNLRSNSARHGSSISQTNRFHHRSASLPSLSPDLSDHQHSSTSTPSVRVPRPSPVSPTMLTDYQKRMLWKKKLQAVREPTGGELRKEKASIVGVHELYENDELLQDWKDVYIASAYLIWCQTSKRKRRKAKSTGSNSRRKDPHRISFKDVTEDMIPAAMEKIKPEHPKPRRSPTVGQPYNPSRGRCHPKMHIQDLDLSSYGLGDFGDFPKSVITGIIQHFKPSQVAVSHELPLGLEVQPKQQSSPRTATDLSTQFKSIENLTGDTLEQTLQDENSRMLLDIDINSHFTPPGDEKLTEEEGGLKINSESKQDTDQLQPQLIKTVIDRLAGKRGRELLPLASVGVPFEHRAKSKLHHCVNSIPRNLDLGVALEPVDVVSVTPTPTGTPKEEMEGQESQPCTLANSSPDVVLANGSEYISSCDDQMNLHWPLRGHMTSALRYSPAPVHAPAPTPNSPDRHGQYFSRTPQSREHNNSVTSRYIRRRETLTSVYDEDETETSREALGSPEGERVEEEFAVEPVFLTEGALSRDLSLVLNKKDAQEWPQDKMIINVIENSDDMPRMLRSPSPGSKTFIPQDILAEFQGDPYGRKGMHVAGQKMTGKPNIVKEPETTTDLRGYMAPAWRAPRSRTPIQLVDTPSRRAPRPLKQPPKESLPKSLTVQPLAKHVLRRPKSTPPRMSSPKDSGELLVHQILSDSTLGSFTRDEPGKYSMDTRATSPSMDTSGSIPPPPSPELTLVAPVVPGTPRLDPVCEVEEKSSITSAGRVDGTSQVEGENAVANLSEVEDGDEVDESNEVDIGQHSKHIKSESNSEKETDLAITEETETVETRQNKDSQDTPDINLDRNPVSLFVAGDEANLPVTETDEVIQNETGGDEKESEKQNDSKSANEDATTEESGEREQAEKDNTDLPQPPASPDIVSTPDFTEGLDLNLDLEAELRAAMEGLDDLGDGEENGEKRTSPELEPW